MWRAVSKQPREARTQKKTLSILQVSAPWFSYPVIVISVWGIVFWAIYDTNKNKHRGDTVVKIKKKKQKAERGYSLLKPVNRKIGMLDSNDKM